MFITFLLFSCQEDNPNNFSIFESEAKPDSCEEDSLQFYPENLPDLAPRERDISYHDEGPSVAILDHDNDGVDSIIQCFPDERTYLYRSSGRTELSLPCGKILVEDLNSDGWQDSGTALLNTSTDSHIPPGLTALDGSQSNKTTATAFALGHR